jgi:hypothetical protein
VKNVELSFLLKRRIFADLFEMMQHGGVQQPVGAQDGKLVLLRLGVPVLDAVSQHVRVPSSRFFHNQTTCQQRVKPNKPEREIENLQKRPKPFERNISAKIKRFVQTAP